MEQVVGADRHATRGEKGLLATLKILESADFGRANIVVDITSSTSIHTVFVPGTPFCHQSFRIIYEAARVSIAQDGAPGHPEIAGD